MRILLITDWNRGRGGAEAYALWLRERLRTAGDDARLLTSSAGSPPAGAADYTAFGTERILAQVFLQIMNPFAAAAARRALRDFRPHAALVNMFALHLSAAVLRELRMIPTVLLVSDYKCICPVGTKLLPDGSLCNVPVGWVCHRSGCVGLAHWLRDRPRYALIRSEISRVSRVVSCSRWVQRELAAAGIPSEAVLWPAPAPSPDFVRIPSDDPVFVYSGRLAIEKGVALLLRAFARLRAEVPSARLRIIGEGRERPNLERLAAGLGVGDSVAFHGWLDPPELECRLRDAWAAVVPSLWAEPLGLVAIEAIMRGVPVIASASGGLGEIVEHGVSGLLFPNNDEAALADCLRAVADGAVFPNHIVPAAAVERCARTFSMEEHIRHVRKMLTEVAGV